ncbi:MAG: hypothetical protein AB8F78_13315 [Saprospiraceae bacterium]
MRLPLPLLILLFTSCLALFSCNKDEELDTLSPNSSLSLDMVTASFSGTVTGKVGGIEGRAVEGAEITIGTTTTTTNSLGKWQLENVLAPKDRAFIKVDHNSYLHGSKTISISEGSSYDVDLQLLVRGRVGSLEASSGGSIVLSNERASFTFLPNSFVTQDGSPYEGQVIVYAQYLDPTTDKGLATMPGDLMAISANGEDVALESFGMLGVELRGEGGQGVQLAAGSPATIRLEVPSSLLGIAPSTIPLWYFDEEIGVWKEEEEAELFGTKYVGEVNHFTWWNCDIPVDFVRLCGTAISDDGSPIRVVARVDAGSQGARTTTSSTNGNFCGFVPNGTPLTLTLITACGDSLVLDLGSLTVDTDLSDILIGSSPFKATFEGKVTDCSGTALSGITVGARSTLGSPYIYKGLTDQDGNFTIDMNSCSSNDSVSVRLLFLDELNVNARSTPLITIHSGGTLGSFEMCSSTVLQEFLSAQIDHEIYVCDEPTNINYNENPIINGFGRFWLTSLLCNNSGINNSQNELNRTVSNNQHTYNVGSYTLADTTASDAIHLKTSIRLSNFRFAKRIERGGWQSGTVDILRQPQFQGDTTVARINAIGIPTNSTEPMSYKVHTRGMTRGNF